MSSKPQAMEKIWLSAHRVAFKIREGQIFGQIDNQWRKPDGTKAIGNL
jgi:ribosomal protein L32E